MAVMQSVLAALFPDDGRFVWRRRMLVLSVLVFLVVILHVAFGRLDIEYARLLMEWCVPGLLGALGIHVAGGRKAAPETPGAPQPGGPT
jgi:hypothetical protein